MQLFENNIETTLNGAIDAVVTAITVADSSGMPVPTGGDYFLLTIYAGATWEVVKVTDNTTNVLTVVRGHEGAASAWSDGASCSMNITKDTLEVMQASTTGAALGVAQTWTAGQRGEVTPLTDAVNIAVNLDDSNFFSVTLADNRTLDNPSNIVAGQSGSIFISQDATGSRTLAFGTNWDFEGGTIPTLSTAANAVDRLDYVVRGATSIHTALSKAWS